MSFVTTRPEAMAAAASTLEGLGTAVNAHTTAAAGPTTGVAPAAADPVSALQATQFNAYGTLYQQISAQAAAIHQQVVNTLGSNAAAYGATESVNTLAAANPLAAAGNPLDPLRLFSGADGGPFGIVAAAIGNGGVIGAMQMSNFGSAASDFIQLGSNELVTDTQPEQEAAGIDHEQEATAVPLRANAGGAGVTQVAATGGQPAPRLSVPPSWGTTPTVQPGPATALTETAPAVAGEAPAGAVPAGLPGAAAGAAEHDSGGAGPARYAAKPNLTPRPPGV